MKNTLFSRAARTAALVALMCGAGLLSGCVVYPAGPGFYGHPHYYCGWRCR